MVQAWEFSHFPISSLFPYDRFGKIYNVTRVMHKDDTFDMEAYKNYSPLYLPATYATTYLLAFALCTCVIVHTFLYHGRSLLNGFQKGQVEDDDIHAKLMRNYAEVPNWWYQICFVTCFGLAIVAVEVGASVTIFIDPAILMSADFRFGMWGFRYGRFYSLSCCPLSMSYHLDSFLR